MPSGDRQQPIPVKNVALTDLSNKMTNIMPQTHGNSPISKDQGRNIDFPNMPGTKRQHTTSSSPVGQHRLGNPSANGHLVYVRRKLDHEVAVKTCSFNNAGTVGSPEPKNEPDHEVAVKACFFNNAGAVRSPEPKNDVSNVIKETEGRQEQIEEPKHFPLTINTSVPASPKSTPSEIPLLAHGLEKPNNGFEMHEPNDSVVTATISLTTDTRQPDTPHWKERFAQLQVYLDNVGQSKQEEYTRMLRSLSAAARSIHAHELEKRHLQLAIEEAKVLHHMKALNVLGKSSP